MTANKIKAALIERLDPQQRIRWLIMLMVILVFTAILYPGLVVTDFAYRIGDVAERDIKASRDFLIEDRQATENNQRQAAEQTLTVYDHDVLLAGNVTQNIDQVFSSMRKTIAEQRARVALHTAAQIPEDEATAAAEIPSSQTVPAPAEATPLEDDRLSIQQITAEKQSEFSENLGITLRDDIYQVLVASEFSQTIADQMTQIIYEILQNGVVPNKEILLRESEKGIILRTVGTGKERTLRNLRQFYDLEEAKMMARIMGQPMFKDLGYNSADLIVDMIQALLQPNITLNRNETQERRKTAVEAIKPVFHKIKAGEMLLREGERVTPVQILKLRALQEEQLGQRIALSSMGAAMIMACVLLAAYLLRFGGYRIRALSVNKDVLFSAVVLCTFFVIAEVAGSLSRTLAQNTQSSFEAISLFYATPLTAATMLACLFLGLESAILLAMILAIGAAIVFHGSFEALVFFLVSGPMAALWVQNCRERKVFIKAGLMTGLLNIILASAIGVYAGFESAKAILWGCAFGFLGGVASAILATGLVPIIEILFEYTSDIKLLELANLDQPLMRKLMIEAPGTYHHSVIVGNMVEAAAAEIGANPLLAKVCGYYHDIGKIRKPAYFIENQTNGRNRHDKLAPSMSALILIAHIKDGMDLARRNKLGNNITDTIRQHHGTSLIHFFYEKAIQLKGEDAVNIDDYRYPGPKPQTREAGLVMLADAVEAASRVLDNPTPSRLQGLVQRLINRIFSDGQLDNCELTLRDLHNIAKSFNTILNGIHHHRIEYPERRSGALGKKKGRNGSSDRQSAKRSDPQRETEENRYGHLKRLGLS
jgi:putative nucleotidyltransferase with HDIG domain